MQTRGDTREFTAGVARGSAVSGSAPSWPDLPAFCMDGPPPPIAWPAGGGSIASCESLRLSILVSVTMGLVGIAGAAQQSSTSAPQPSTQSPAFRAGVEVVSLNATVTDAGHRYIADLEPSSSPSSRTAWPKTSRSSTGDGIRSRCRCCSTAARVWSTSFPTLQAAATAFVGRLTPDDLAQIVDFDGSVKIPQPFTSNKPDLQSSDPADHCGGSTALYTAVYIALRELGKVRVGTENVRRQALIVFSDGADTSSVVSFDEVLDLAKHSATGIYAIALRDADPRSNSSRGGDWVMRSLAQETGGRAFFPAKIDDLAGAYGQIADELASQYTLAYTSKNLKRDGAWRRLTVRLSRPGLTARARAGYYAQSRAERTHAQSPRDKCSRA